MTYLPEGWTRALLGELCDLYQPKTISREQMVPEGAYLVYGANGVIGRYSEYNHEESEVLLSCRGNCGTVNVSKPKSWVNGNAMVCRPKNSVLLKSFLAVALEGTDFSSVITGTAQQQITRKPLAALVVPVPPVAEQERIVEILEGQFSRLDSALASVKAVREKAQAFRRSLLHAAFSGELTGGTEGWRMVAIGEVADVLNGDRGKNYPSKKFRTASGVPFVNAGHLEGASIAMSEMDFISDEHFALLGAGKFTVGDILFCIRGSLGKLALNKSIQVGAIASSLVIVRPREEVTPAFLHYFLSSPQTSSQIKQYDNGTAQPNLAAANFKRFITPLPSLATQERIVSVLEEQFSRLDNALEVANQLEARIASERRSLLHGAFTGALTATWRETHV